MAPAQDGSGRVAHIACQHWHWHWHWHISASLNLDATQAKACLDAIKTTVVCDMHANKAAYPDACGAAVAGKGAEGAACVGSYDCVSTAYCDSSGTVCPSTCKARKGDGESATDGTQCQSGRLVATSAIV